MVRATSYLVGRAFMRSREIDMATRLFSRVPESSVFGHEARACLAILQR